MPTVPEYSQPLVQPQALPTVSVSDAPVNLASDAYGQQAKAFDNATSQIASTTNQIGMDMLQQANQLRVDDAVNQAKEQALKLTYDPNSGFTNLKGSAALQRPDGQSLQQEYGGQLQSSIAGISANLGNDAQRIAFQQRMQPLMAQFDGDIMRHENQQFQEYAQSVREGTISNAVNMIGVNYNNPAVVDDSIRSIQAATYDLARLNGRSAEWAEAQARKMTSNAHLTALQAALQNNDPIYADQYLKKYAGQMDADDILKANAGITKEVDAKIGQAAATQAITSLQPSLQPSSFQRLTNLVMGQESGGKDFDSNGQILTSPKGAKGSMQVLDSTMAAPGLPGVAPLDPKTATPAQRAQFGRDYLQGLLQKYQGNVAQGLAAYNAGFGAVDDALDKAKQAGAPNAWLSYLPNETQNYVQNITKQFGSGGGAPQMPTLLDVHNQVRQALGPNARSQTLQIALDAATKQYTDYTAAKKQNEDTAVANAQRALIANNGDFAGLSPDVRAAIPPGQYDNVMKFAGALSKGEQISTDWGLYYQLKTDPQVLAGTNLGALRDKLANSEFKELTDQQMNIRAGKTDPMTQVQSANEILAGMMRTADINPTPKPGSSDAPIVGRIMNDFSNRVAAQEQALGRKLKPDELRYEAGQTMQQVRVNGGLFGIFGGTKSVPLGSITPTSNEGPDAQPRTFDIPSGQRTQLGDALRAGGFKVSESNIQSMYRRTLQPRNLWTPLER